MSLRKRIFINTSRNPSIIIKKPKFGFASITLNLQVSSSLKIKQESAEAKNGS